MDKSTPTKTKPLSNLRPIFADNDNNQTENISSPTSQVVTPLQTVDDEGYTTTHLPPLVVSPLRIINDETHNTKTPLPPLIVSQLRTIGNETHNTILSPPPLMVTPLSTINYKTHNTTTHPPHLQAVSPLRTINDETHNTTISSPPLVVSPLPTVNEKTHNTSAPPHPILATPLQTIIPFDDSNKESLAADADPNIGSIKRGRGRPKGSKNSKMSMKKLKTYHPNSKAVASCLNDETHNRSAPPHPLFATPLQTIIPFDDSNKDSLAADADPSIGPVKRGRGRPKGSKNLKTPMKKQKAYHPNSKVVRSCPGFDSRITEAERETGNQELVDSVLMRFDAVRRRLCQLKCAEAVLTTAFINCRNLGVRTNMKKRIGPVPGVQVGDIFYFWGEMCLVGLHMQMVAGIDYLTVKDGSTEGPLATSVVTSGHYNDETEDLQTLIYTGHGGIDKNGQAIDQKLERGNFALEASKRKGYEVRVIRGEEDPSNKKKKIYIYDGLYLVVDCWKTKGNSGFDEFKFKLVRKPDQPSGYANWKSAEAWRKCGLNKDLRKGFILEDLSFGKETSPIPLVNEIDEKDKERPQDFSYTASSASLSMMVVLKYQSTACSDCQGQICEDPKCPCIQRNGSELPYHNRVLVCRKPVIYECGNRCPCPPNCKNRVTQTGLKIRLEVFKTENCGWGLRSWEPIRAGTFICELVGMAKRRDEIEEDDVYVFDTSRVYKKFRWNYEPELVSEDCWEQVSEVYKLRWQILVSAKKHGNVSRFLNHSCSPNVMWQPIEFEDTRRPSVRIAFFAIKHIPPLTELRYDYGMSCETEEVEEDGKKIFKGKKICLCGSAKCRGSFE